MTADEVRIVREALGLTQAQLAERLGYKYEDAVAELERGEQEVTLDIAYAVRWLCALRCSDGGPSEDKMEL